MLESLTSVLLIDFPVVPKLYLPNDEYVKDESQMRVVPSLKDLLLQVWKAVA